MEVCRTVTLSGLCGSLWVDALGAGGMRCRSCSVPNTEEAAAAYVRAAVSSAWLRARARTRARSAIITVFACVC